MNQICDKVQSGHLHQKIDVYMVRDSYLDGLHGQNRKHENNKIFSCNLYSCSIERVSSAWKECGSGSTDKCLWKGYGSGSNAKCLFSPGMPGHILVEPRMDQPRISC